MCGIAGWIDRDVDLTTQRAILAAMSGTLDKRGPDSHGAWVSPRAALLHRRLIVVDPAGGAQPMVHQQGEHTHVLVYNGELYNTEEIRRQLLAHGHTFRGHSDTEVLLKAFVQWGPDCVAKFNGIFAFAIWSEREQRLFVARDRLGVKPLFFAQRGSGFFFGSELKALLAHPAIEPVLDTEGLAEIFALGPGRTPGHGVFKGVHELRPGHALLLGHGGQVRTYAYWQLESKEHEDDFTTTVQTVRELFLDTVQRQLVSDVPVCTLLSGGLDSSAITAVAASHYEITGRGVLDTYSVDYVDNDRYFQPSEFQPNSDAPFIRRMVDLLATRHHEVRVDTPELVAALAAAMRARDLPGMADVDSSLYLFCQEIKRDATVALSGECADEVFGGYPWLRRPESVQADTFPWALRMHEKLPLLSREVRDRIQPEQYVRERYHAALGEVPRLAGETPAEARMRELFYLNLFHWMPVLLDRKDRMSMGVGLEIRVPFCDHRLVEYVWNVPMSMKFHQAREKGLLREALTGILPADILWRKKSPYPKTHNPSYLAATRALLQQVLDDDRSPIGELLEKDDVRTMLTAHGEFDIPWFGQLMRLPQLFAYLWQVDSWMREYRVRIR